MPADDIARLSTFTPNTDIVSAEVNAELNQLVTTCNNKMGRDVANTLTGANTFSGVATFTAPPLTNQIDERTSGSGVTVDSVLLKDGMVKVAGTATVAGQIGYSSNLLKYHNGTSELTIATTDNLSTTMDALTDTTFTSLATNNTLRYDGTNWINYIPRFKSTAQTITSAGALTISHGLKDTAGNAVAPNYCAVSLKCTDAGGDAGYSQNEEIFYINGGPTNESMGCTIRFDTSSLYIRFGSAASPFYVNHKSTGAGTGLSATKWQAYFYAGVI